ncbi:MAG: DUF421 domain-containing protein [Halanaerobiaceae bacterium]
MNILDISIKLTIGFVFIFIVTKVIGKTQINQITPFDFISALVMGELLGNAIYDKEVGLFYIFYTLFLWAFLIIFIQFLSQKFLKTRGVLEGNPAVIIRNGIIDYKVLKKNKLNLNTLQELLREKDAFSVRDVEYAILESSGNLSVLKKSGSQQPDRDDFSLSVKPVNLSVTLISDGKILWDNLDSAGLNINWLKEEIKAEGYQSIEDIFYAEWLDGNGLFLQGYNT